MTTRTSTARRPTRDPEDCAADRRIVARYWSLPHAAVEFVDTRIGWHLLLGTGRRGEAQLENVLQQLVTARAAA